MHGLSVLDTMGPLPGLVGVKLTQPRLGALLRRWSCPNTLTTLTWLRCPYLADPSPHCQATPTHPSTLPKPSQEPPGRICLGSSAPNHTLLPNSNRAEGTFLPTLPAPRALRALPLGARGGPAGGYATRPSRRSSTVKSCGDVDADIAASRLITPSRNRPTRCWSNVCIP